MFLELVYPLNALEATVANWLVMIRVTSCTIHAIFKLVEETGKPGIDVNHFLYFVIFTFDMCNECKRK